MVDPKIKTFLTLVECGSFSAAAKLLSLTQPAVSTQIKLLEGYYKIKIFHKGKRPQQLSFDGEVLYKYAQRLVSIENAAFKAIENSRNNIKTFNVGITETVGEALMSQIILAYCAEHPQIHINIITDNIKNIYSKLATYELDWGIVGGSMAEKKYNTILLDTDYLCLVVSPKHSFATKKSVTLAELKTQKLILRSPNTSTRELFDRKIMSEGDGISNYNILIEIDNITTIKELVSANLGVTIMAHSACAEDAESGRLVVVPIQNINILREINIVYYRDFDNVDLLYEIKKIYNSAHKIKH